MSDTASLRFSCTSCNKSYAFKPEYANKKVKCKCGATIAVPDMTTQAEDDLYDIAEDAKPAAPVAKPVPKVSAVHAPTTSSSRPGSAQMLGYRGAPTPAQRQRAQSALVDMKRDVYVPTALIVASFVILLGATMTKLVRGDPMAVSLAFTVFSLINAALLIGGALFIGGKVGISFGGVWSAILKFVAIALFVGMITMIIDAKFGLLGMAVLSLAASVILYSGLFMYLFSMDAEDSIWMVGFFIALRTALSWLLLPILLAFFAGGALVTGGSGRLPASSAQTKLAQRVEDNKELGLVEEAGEFVKSGKQSYWTDGIKVMYEAGAKFVGFCVVRDINGRGSPYSIVIQMPDDPTTRAKIVKALNDWRAATHNPDLGPPPVLVDVGGDYLEVELNG